MTDVALKQLNNLRAEDNGDGSFTLKVISEDGGGNDRELVVSTYRARAAFTGASVGDTITSTQIIDLTGAPVTVSTIWRNQTTGTDFAAVPPAASLDLVGAGALTDSQLRASALAVADAGLGTDGATPPAITGTGVRGWLRAIFERLTSGISIMGSVRVSGYDSTNDLLRVGSMQKKMRDDFAGAVIDPARWDVTVGSGMTATVASSELAIASGTTTNAVTTLVSKDYFTAPMRVSAALRMSQRIAQQQFLVELVAFDPVTNTLDETRVAAFLFDGATATQAQYRVNNGAASPLDSGAVSFPTTASNTVFEIELTADEVWFHAVVMDSSNGRANTYRRHNLAPDPTLFYKIRLRLLNLTSPASSTTVTLPYVACQDYAELTAEITAGRGNAGAGQALPVNVVTGNVNINSNNSNVFWNDSTTAQAANATLTGTSRDAGVAAGGNHRYGAFNAFALADQAGTLRIECSNDGTTWRRATVDTVVAANTPVYLSVPVMTRNYRAVYVNGATLQTVFMLNTSFTAA